MVLVIYADYSYSVISGPSTITGGPPSGGPSSGSGGIPSSSPVTKGGSVAPSPIPWWVSPVLNTGSAISSYMSLIPPTKFIGTGLGFGFTAGSVGISYYNWRNGYISDKKFTLEVGLALTPMIGAKFAGPVTKTLIGVTEHQLGVVNAVMEFTSGQGK